MNKSSHKWKIVLTDLGHPNVESWDDKTFNAALFRCSRERQELLDWLAPKILECSGCSKKFPVEIALQDIYARFVYIPEEEISSFISGSLLKDKQVEIWHNIFWKVDTFRNKARGARMEVVRLPEEQALIDRAHSALIKAEEVLSQPLPQIMENGFPPVENRVAVSSEALISGIKNFCDEAKHLNVDPATANLEVNLTTLKTLSEMAEAMKRMSPSLSS